MKITRALALAALAGSCGGSTIDDTTSIADAALTRPGHGIPARHALLAIPTGTALAGIILAKPHPRALPAGSTFAAIAASAAAGEYRQSYAGFLAAADHDLTAPITPVPPELTLQDFGGDEAK